MQTTNSLPSASLWRQLMAMVYDSLIVAAVIIAYGGAVTAIQYGLMDKTLGEGERASMGTLGFLGMIASVMLFYGWFWVKGGQTVGMRAWRLRVVSPTSERPLQQPSWPQSIVRWCGALLSLACAGLGYWWILIDKDNASWHDRISNTCVVVDPKLKKS